MPRYLTHPDALRHLQEATAGRAGVTRFADSHGLTRQYVSAVLKGERPIGPDLAKALGLEKRVVYVRAS